MGIGGGLILNPLMLFMGVDMAYTRPASNIMVVFTALTAFIKYLSMGAVNFKYCWIYMIVSGSAFPVGYVLSNKIIKIIKTVSVIQFANGIITLISTAFVIYQMVLNFMAVAKSGAWMDFKDLCT